MLECDIAMSQNYILMICVRKYFVIIKGCYLCQNLYMQHKIPVRQTRKFVLFPVNLISLFSNSCDVDQVYLAQLRSGLFGPA